MSFESSLVWAAPGFLCFGEKPGLWRNLQDDLALLHDLNVRAIVSLVENENHIGTYLQAGFSALHIPLQDFQAPTQEQIDTCMQHLQDLHHSQTPVYVHCYAGFGRSGAMAAAWLIRAGSPPFKAIHALRSLKPGVVETDTQVNAILEYAARRGLPCSN